LLLVGTRIPGIRQDIGGDNAGRGRTAREMLSQEAHRPSARRFLGKALRRAMAGGAVLREQLRAGLPGIEVLAARSGGPEHRRQDNEEWPPMPGFGHSVPPFLTGDRCGRSLAHYSAAVSDFRIFYALPARREFV